MARRRSVSVAGSLEGPRAREQCNQTRWVVAGGVDHERETVKPVVMIAVNPQPRIDFAFHCHERSGTPGAGPGLGIELASDRCWWHAAILRDRTRKGQPAGWLAIRRTPRQASACARIS